MSNYINQLMDKSLGWYLRTISIIFGIILLLVCIITGFCSYNCGRQSIINEKKIIKSAIIDLDLTSDIVKELKAKKQEAPKIIYRYIQKDLTNDNKK